MRRVALSPIAIALMMVSAFVPPFVTGIPQCEPVFVDPKPFAWFSNGFCNAPERADIEMHVSHGEIPAWFRGTLYRNVPAQYDIGPDQVEHWFDGFAQINAIDFSSNGAATLRSRFLNSTMIHTMNATDKRISAKGFYTEPFPGQLFGNKSSPAHGAPHKKGYTNNDVSILEFGGRLFATTDEDLLIEFDPVTLETITPDGMVFNDTIDNAKVNIGVTHGITDNHNGEYINYAMNPVPTAMFQNASFKFWKMDRADAAAEGAWNRTLVREIFLPNANYAHSFGATDEYIVWPENPVRIDAILDAIGVPPLRAMQVMNASSRMHLINRRTGAHHVGTVPQDVGLVMHSANAYVDTDGSVVFDSAMYSDANVFGALAFKPFLSHPDHQGSSLLTGRLTRCRTYPEGAADEDGTARTSCTPLLEGLQAFPWINKRFYGRKHRWVYTTEILFLGRSGMLHKNDMTANTTVSTWFGPVSRPPADIPRNRSIDDSLFVFTEAIFAPKQPSWPLPAELDSAEEEDGLLLTVLYHAASHRSVIAGVDPRTMASAFEMWMPFAIPPHFHGIFCKSPTMPGQKVGECIWN